MRVYKGHFEDHVANDPKRHDRDWKDKRLLTEATFGWAITAHKAQEKDWLAKGVIRQPIDGLLALMRRDTRLRRPEVCVMWPASLLDEIFKTLAPKVKAQVTQNPSLDIAQKALTAHACRLFVFQSPGQSLQSVAVAIGVQEWSNNQWASIDLLSERVQHALKPDAFEHLVAVATID